MDIDITYDVIQNSIYYGFEDGFKKYRYYNPIEQELSNNRFIINNLQLTNTFYFLNITNIFIIKSCVMSNNVYIKYKDFENYFFIDCFVVWL